MKAILAILLTMNSLTSQVTQNQSQQIQMQQAMNQFLNVLQEPGNQIFYMASDKVGQQNLAIIKILNADGTAKFLGIDVNQSNPLNSAKTFANEEQAMKFLGVQYLPGQFATFNPAIQYIQTPVISQNQVPQKFIYSQEPQNIQYVAQPQYQVQPQNIVYYQAPINRRIPEQIISTQYVQPTLVNQPQATIYRTDNQIQPSQQFQEKTYYQPYFRPIRKVSEERPQEIPLRIYSDQIKPTQVVYAFSQPQPIDPSKVVIRKVPELPILNQPVVNTQQFVPVIQDKVVFYQGQQYNCKDFRLPTSNQTSFYQIQKNDNVLLKGDQNTLLQQIYNDCFNIGKVQVQDNTTSTKSNNLENNVVTKTDSNVVQQKTDSSVVQQKTDQKQQAQGNSQTTVTTTTTTSQTGNQAINFDNLELNLNNLNTFFDVLEQNKDKLGQIDLSQLANAQQNQQGVDIISELSKNPQINATTTVITKTSTSGSVNGVQTQPTSSTQFVSKQLTEEELKNMQANLEKLNQGIITNNQQLVDQQMKTIQSMGTQ